MADETFKYTVIGDPNWDFRTLDIGKDIVRAHKTDNGIVSATSTNLKPYVGRGSKLIIYHGWADQNVSPLCQLIITMRSWMAGEEGDGLRRLSWRPAWGIAAAAKDPVFRHADPARAMEGAGRRAERDHRLANGERQRDPHPSAVPVSAGGQYKGTGSTDQAENFVCRLP